MKIVKINSLRLILCEIIYTEKNTSIKNTKMLNLLENLHKFF